MKDKEKTFKKNSIIRLFKEAVKETDIFAFSWSKLDHKKILYPFRMMFHPSATASEIKNEKCGSLALANIILVLYFILTILKDTSFGFIFKNKTTDVFNIWPLVLQSVGLVVLWVVSMWSLSTLLDGEGRFIEIWITTCYSLMPAILLTAPYIIMSNLLLIEEIGLLTLLNTITNIWVVILIFSSTMVIQDYTVSKTIAIMVISLIGILAIIFLAVMFFSMFQQFYIFLTSVFKEAMFRV